MQKSLSKEIFRQEEIKKAKQDLQANRRVYFLCYTETIYYLPLFSP